MSVRMKLTFASPEPKDENKKFSIDEEKHVEYDYDYYDEEDFEAKKREFKNDEELMRETTKFVSELIETAQIEAAKRSQQKETSDTDSGKFKIDQIAEWSNRARGFCNRAWNRILSTSNRNELLAWTEPFKMRFSRP